MEREYRPGGGFYWQEAPHHGHDGWDGPLHAIVFLLLVALLIVGIAWLLRRFSPGLTTPVTAPALAQAAAISADPAVAALRMRYAKGDVSREDFQNAMTDLTGAAPAAPWPGDAPGEDTAPTPS